VARANNQPQVPTCTTVPSTAQCTPMRMRGPLQGQGQSGTAEQGGAVYSSQRLKPIRHPEHAPDTPPCVRPHQPLTGRQVNRRAP